MKYNGKELHKYKKGELVTILEKVLDELQFLDGTHPPDLKKDDMADTVWEGEKIGYYPKDVVKKPDDWEPPKNVSFVIKGKR